jgi:molybdenum cofactor cytidylyltransferase
MSSPLLLPAAGKSERMGRPKLLLSLAGRTVLGQLLTAARSGGAWPALVVVRPGDVELAETARGEGASVLVLPADTADMRATVIAGLEHLEAAVSAAERVGFFLVPADHPTLTADVFRGLADEAGHGDASIVVPVHQGQRGHPVWIRWDRVEGLRRLAPGQGINAYLRQHADTTREVAWPDDAILTDLDTPEDYRRLVERWPGSGT